MTVAFQQIFFCLSALLFFSELRGATAVDERFPSGRPPETSLSLLQCLDIAVRMNPELLRASTGLTDAEGRALQFRAILYPRIQTQVVSTPPTIYVQVQQVLYDRAVDPLLKMSRLAGEEAELNYRLVLTEVLFQTRQAFSVALAGEKRVYLLDHYQKVCHETIQRGNQLFEAGKIQKAELARLEVKSNEARQMGLQARSSLQQSLLELEKMTGQKLPENIRLEGKLGDEKLPELNPENLTIEAYLNRADYQALKKGKAFRTQQLVLSTRQLYPRLAAGTNSVIQPGALGFTKDYDLNRNDNEPNIQRAGGNTQIPLSAYLSWTFFDGGSSAGLKQSEEAGLASQNEVLEALGRSIPGEIREALNNIEFAQKTLETLVLSPDPEKLRETSQLDYQEGRLRLLDRSLLEETLFTQEEKILESRLHFSLSAAALDRSLGRVVQFR
jgi:outer membrane protein TolC